MDWKDFGFAIHAQAALRLLACLLLPSLFVAGAIATRSNLRVFCSAAVAPAAIPLLLVWQDAAIQRMFQLLAARDARGVCEVLQIAAWGCEEWITTLWVLAPGVGLLSTSLHWLLRGGDNSEESGRLRRPVGLFVPGEWLGPVTV
jgi:hypothetical protein